MPEILPTMCGRGLRGPAQPHSKETMINEEIPITRELEENENLGEAARRQTAAFIDREYSMGRRSIETPLRAVRIPERIFVISHLVNPGDTAKLRPAISSRPIPALHSSSADQRAFPPAPQPRAVDTPRVTRLLPRLRNGWRPNRAS